MKFVNYNQCRCAGGVRRSSCTGWTYYWKTLQLQVLRKQARQGISSLCQEYVFQVYDLASDDLRAAFEAPSQVVNRVRHGHADLLSS
jgi:hypothetical protein